MSVPTAAAAATPSMMAAFLRDVRRAAGASPLEVSVRLTVAARAAAGTLRLRFRSCSKASGPRGHPTSVQRKKGVLAERRRAGQGPRPVRGARHVHANGARDFPSNPADQRRLTRVASLRADLERALFV